MSYSKSAVVRMRNKLGNALIALGVLALLAAVLLMGYNQWDSTRAEKAADSVLTQLEESIAEPRTIYPGDAAEPTADTEMPVGTIDGYDYIGYLSIPSIGLALPVMQQWSYPGLKIAPGRYSGSLYTDDLVIAGHNYARHFSPLTHLTVGTEVLFVDMNDNTWHYAVSDTEVLQPTQIEEMAFKTPDSNWDLTLFTCTTTGQARYALRPHRRVSMIHSHHFQKAKILPHWKAVSSEMNFKISSKDRLPDIIAFKSCSCCCSLRMS